MWSIFKRKTINVGVPPDDPAVRISKQGLITMLRRQRENVLAMNEYMKR